MNATWEKVLAELRKRMSEHTFTAWFEPLGFLGIENSVLRISIPHRFFADWIAPRYSSEILSLACNFFSLPIERIEWVVAQEKVQEHQEKGPLPPSFESVTSPGWISSTTEGVLRRLTPKSRASDPRTPELPFTHPTTHSESARLEEATQLAARYRLHPRYRFENFVVGLSNQLAHAAALAASERPGKRYNPLFIYAKVGLGKTHLINAIGHHIRDRDPCARVIYTSAERFTSEFISALQQRRIDEFRARYRSRCDVLIVDDVQFLAGREQTQEEFFHTFNALYHADKQIVLTSDLPPHQIQALEERLVSRFQWGIAADIQPPELDTRMAILKKKAELEGIALSEEVAFYIAERVQSNIRELEGTLLRLAMQADLQKRPIDLALADFVLNPRNKEEKERGEPSIDALIAAVASHFGLRRDELIGESRHRGVAIPRMVGMYLARSELHLSYGEIGKSFGGRDHSTVLNACRRIAGLLEQGNPQIQLAINAIRSTLFPDKSPSASQGES
ncbi:MAG: chromosomal replication initiator protein DnaA [Sandaracinaceae bacterium]|nr:chromosomal replication initiator protein DnaA [Sandaracinaceae bacterium]